MMGGMAGLEAVVVKADGSPSLLFLSLNFLA